MGVVAVAATANAVNEGIKAYHATKNTSGGTVGSRSAAVGRAKDIRSAGRSGCELKIRYECSWWKSRYRQKPHVHVDVFKKGTKVETIHIYYR